MPQMNTHYHHKRLESWLETWAQRLATTSGYYLCKTCLIALSSLHCLYEQNTVTSFYTAIIFSWSQHRSSSTPTKTLCLLDAHTEQGLVGEEGDHGILRYRMEREFQNDAESTFETQQADERYDEPSHRQDDCQCVYMMLEKNQFIVLVRL